MTDILSLIPEDLREEAAAVLASDPTLQQWLDAQDSYWANFVPRPDKPEEFDEQASFCLNRDPVSFLVGGNACLREDTLIDTAVDKRAIADCCQPFETHSLYGKVQSTRAWVKPRKASILRVVLSNGSEFYASAEHRVLAVSSEQTGPHGRVASWLPVYALRPHTFLASDANRILPHSPDLPAKSWLKRDCRLSQTLRDSLGSCLPGLRRCDEQFPVWIGVFLRLIQQRADALARSLGSLHLGDLLRERECIHPCLFSGHPSICELLPRIACLCAIDSQGKGGDCERQAETECTVGLVEESKGSPANPSPKVSELFRRGSFLRNATTGVDRSARDMDETSPGVLSDWGTVQVTAIERTGQDWVWTCHIPVGNHYASCGVFHHNSGTTSAAAWKTANYLLRQQPPPRLNTPFWIISDTYEQVMGVCWAEKLHGQKFIPDCEIDWPGVRWYDSKRGLPFSVPLKPWPGRPGKNWTLEFKSYKQGRRSMQARSIGGFWFSEQFPLTIFLEVLRGCREYMFPGGQFAEFTPIDPELCVWVEKVMDETPKGWKFYRCNTACNVQNLADGWFDQFFATVPDELLQTRMIGALATFVGCIYPSFNPAVHVKAEPFLFPPGITHRRATDWGASEEHPHATVWGYEDGMGDWHVYDEYWSADQTRVTMDHAVEIMARSLFWGWPPPLHVFQSDDKILLRFCELVFERLDEIDPERRAWVERFVAKPGDIMPLRPSDDFGYSYADPSRPGEMTAFSRYGIQMAPASNDVYEGINCVRSLLKVNPYTSKPKIYIHPRCVHLTEEMRKYRWMKGRTVADGATLNPQVAKPVPLKRSEDCCDALRYLVFSPTRYGKETPGSLDHRVIAQQRKSVQLDGHGRWRISR